MKALPIQKRSISSGNSAQLMTDQQQLEEPLASDRQHKVEWETLASIEKESWRILDKQHQQAILQLRSAKASWTQQLTTLKEQLVDIHNLHRTNQQKRATLQQRQTMEKRVRSSELITDSTGY